MFRLTILNAIELGEIQFSEILIEKYAPQISKVHRENAINYGKALVNFYKKDFDMALHYSSMLDGNFFVTDQKALRIILFIEKKFHTECEAEIKAFKKFLKTNKFLSPSIKEQLENFCYFAPYVNNSERRMNMLSKKRLKQEMDKKKKIYFKHWLLEKIDGL